MKKFICAALLLASGAFAQENYSQWLAYNAITVNTATDTVNGLPTVASAATVTNFPMLVRLTSANSDVFAASANGADIRFTDTLGTTRYKHQLERWDATNKVAEFWVLVPSLTGGAVTNLRMYWGKSGAADSSSGKAVFDTGNGFRGVWHMNGTGNELDATVNADTLTAFTGAAAAPSAAGGIGNARSFDGATQFFIASHPTTATGPLNITSTSPYTISSWVNASVLSTSTSSGNSIINKGDKQYNLQMYNLKWESATYASTYREAKSTAAALTGGWYHLVGVWPGGTTGNVSARMYVNGAYLATSLSSSGSAPVTASNVYVGVNPSSGTAVSTAPGDENTAPTNSDPRYWNGLLDEITVSQVARDSNWIRLSYSTQKPGATILGLAASVGTSDTVKIAGNPTNQISALGKSATFTVAAVGKATLTYKWVHIHGTSTDTISGATTSTLTLATLAATDTGSYKAVVTNSLGTAVSTAATLRLAVAPVFTTQPVGLTLIVGTSAKFFVVASSIAPLTYKWIHIHGVTTDTISGATTDTLKIASVAMTDSGSYKAIVSNVAGATVSNPATLIVNPVSIWSIVRGNSAFVTQSGSALTFRIPAGASAARVTIADLQGRTVWQQTLLAGSSSSALTWNGNSATGSVPAGIYLLRAALLDAKGNTLNTLQGKFAYRP